MHYTLEPNLVQHTATLFTTICTNDLSATVIKDSTNVMKFVVHVYAVIYLFINSLGLEKPSMLGQAFFSRNYMAELGSIHASIQDNKMCRGKLLW